MPWFIVNCRAWVSQFRKMHIKFCEKKNKDENETENWNVNEFTNYGFVSISIVFMLSDIQCQMI